MYASIKVASSEDELAFLRENDFCVDYFGIVNVSEWNSWFNAYNGLLCSLSKCLMIWSCVHYGILNFVSNKVVLQRVNQLYFSTVGSIGWTPFKPYTVFMSIQCNRRVQMALCDGPKGNYFCHLLSLWINTAMSFSTSSPQQLIYVATLVTR